MWTVGHKVRYGYDILCCANQCQCSEMLRARPAFRCCLTVVHTIQDYVEEQLDEEAFFASQGYAQHQIRTKAPCKVEEKVEGIISTFRCTYLYDSL